MHLHQMQISNSDWSSCTLEPRERPMITTDVTAMPTITDREASLEQITDTAATAVRECLKTMTVVQPMATNNYHQEALH